ncbi:MAG: transporter substrate-binding domain-containing protein [Pseudomonadota bacterium]
MLYSNGLRRIFSLLLLLSALFSGHRLIAADNRTAGVSLTAAERQWLKEHPVITLAPDPDFKPIEYFDKNGNYQGAAADIFRLLEKKLGITITIARLKNWDEAMARFRNREVDLLGAMVRTANREKFALFTDTLVAVPGGIFARAGSPTDLTLKDLKGKKVAVVSNYAAHDIIRSQYPDIELHVVPDVSTGLAKASLGMVDAYVENMANATFYSQEAGITNLQMVGRTEFDYRWGIGIRKDWPELQGILNKGLAAISEEERARAIQRWIYIEGQRWRPTKTFITGAIASSLAGLLLLAINWNHSLRTLVRNRTSSLQRELEERQKAEAALKDLAGQLEQRVSERTAQLNNQIVERIRSEEQLKASEENYRCFTELTSDYVYKCSRLGAAPFRVEWVGGAAESITGYATDEIHRLGCWLPLVHSDDRQAVSTHLIGMVPGDMKQTEFRLITKQGEIIWICETSRCAAGPEKGELILYGSSRDVTARRHAEDELLETKELFTLFMKYSPVYTFIKRIEGDQSRVMQISDNFIEMLGKPAREMLGCTMYEMFPEDFARKITNDDLKVVNDGKVIQLDEQLGERSYTTIKFPIFREGRNSLLAGFTIDITERKRAEEERLQLEKQLLHTQKLESLGVLAGGIAHDFNNILMAVIGNADLALMRINRESPAVENLHRIEKAAERAAELAKQMLAYSGKGKFVIECLDMNRLLEEMLHMLEVSISKKAVLRFTLHTPLPTVEADATQMRQIIMNLVINASEAIGDRSGVISVSTGCMECDRNYLKDVWLDESLSDGLYVYLEITDSGCGMDRETMAKLFDPFFTTKFTGRGLGMAAVLGIVRGHHGAIKVYSEPGKGSSFKILLPAADRPPEVSCSESDSADWRGSGTVLLVDDEETVRGIGGEMLRELGFQVLTASDGRDALEIFRGRDDISFVILDLTMPHMDGEQCFRELRRLKPEVKVIMTSGYNEYEVTQKFIGKGLAGFIQKPYRLAVLRDVLGNLERAT